MSGIKGKTGIYKRTANQRNQILVANFNTRFKKGQKMSIKIKNKISLTMTGKKKEKVFFGIESHNWRGGITTYERKLYLNLRRRSRLLNASGSHTLEEWQRLKEYFNYICQGCFKQEPEIKLTQDHIIPLVLGGSDYISNIQPLCKLCNSKKSKTKIEKLNMRGGELNVRFLTI